MKLTPAVESRLNDMKLDYCKQMGHKRIPLLFLRKEDLPSKGLKISVALCLRHEKNLLGLTYYSTGRKPDCIWLNVPACDDWDQLEKTLVHELVHSRFRWQGHDADFYIRIGEVLAGRTF